MGEQGSAEEAKDQEGITGGMEGEPGQSHFGVGRDSHNSPKGAAARITKS